MSNFNISELSTNTHTFKNFHFCRGNTNRRKSRFGIIEKGSGSYMYLNKKLAVSEGDIVFIPERIFCYSEWHGDPEIKVTYISCFMHYDTTFYEYEPQKLCCDDDVRACLLEISHLLSGDFLCELEAYSLFYHLLQSILPNMKKSRISTDIVLQKAIEYITSNWDADFSVGDISRACLVSESKLYHLFRSELGQTPISFLNSIKINYAISHLENSSLAVSEIARICSFSSENHFRKVFFDITGTTPLKYRKALRA